MKNTHLNTVTPSYNILFETKSCINFTSKIYLHKIASKKDNLKQVKIKWAIFLAKPGVHLKPPILFTTKGQRDLHHRMINRPPPWKDKNISFTKEKRDLRHKRMELPYKRIKEPIKGKKHEYVISIRDVSIQKLKKPIYFGTKSSNCFRTFPPKRRKDTHQIFSKI